MDQSRIIVGALLAGFIAWLLITGRLAKYWALLTGGGAVASTGTSSGGSSTPPPATSSPSQLANTTTGTATGGPIATSAATAPQNVIALGGNWFSWNLPGGQTQVTPYAPQDYTQPIPDPSTARA